MANFYTYLISSLPMLNLGMRLPFSFTRFLEICREFIPEQDFYLLSNLPQAEEYSACNIKNSIIRKWVEFNTALRNELVKARSSRQHIDQARYLRPDGYFGHSLVSLVLTAQRSPSIIEAEKMLDEARWKALDELAVGHYFDLEFLITYGYKLFILERWERVQNADKTALLEETLKN